MPSRIGTPPQELLAEPKTVPSLPLGFDEQALGLASNILDIICQYALRRPKELDLPELDNKLGFLSMIYKSVRAEEPVLMCLPAFPFKSPNNRDKVLGILPDKAEEFALAHMNGLCAQIGDIYKPGARLTIVSDGLVYNGKRALAPESLLTARACSDSL
jgi:hypothetical protein